MKKMLSQEARYSLEKMSKVDIFSGDHLMVGLNCLEEGQSQSVHTHAGSEKFYVVLQGCARFVVGEQTLDAEKGEIVLCPAGVPHGIERALQRTLILVGIAPPPKK